MIAQKSGTGTAIRHSGNTDCNFIVIVMRIVILYRDFVSRYGITILKHDTTSQYNQSCRRTLLLVHTVRNAHGMSPWEDAGKHVLDNIV